MGDTLRRTISHGNEETFLQKIEEQRIIPSDFKSFIKNFVGKKHLIFKDLHGDIDKMEWLFKIVNVLETTHKTLILETLIKDDKLHPHKQIERFYSRESNKNPDVMIKIYDKLQKLDIDIVSGDYEYAQPKNFLNYDKYVNIRYQINKNAAEEIKICKNPTISFWGSEHANLSENIDGLNKYRGIPNFLELDTFIVIEHIRKDNYSYKKILHDLAFVNVDEDINLVFIVSTLEIDFPHLFIIER